MEDGDVVSIGSNLDRFANRIEIRGHVFRPGMFQLGNEIKTVKQLVERAGGLTEDAFTDRALIMREQDDLSLETVSFDLVRFFRAQMPTSSLRRMTSLSFQASMNFSHEGSLPSMVLWPTREISHMLKGLPFRT